MRIHSNIINATHLTDAVRGAGKIGDGYVYLDLTTHSSRKRAHAFEVRLTGDGTFSKRRTQQGDDYAATWCAWGAFLADLFDVDPQMVAGPYDGRADFHRRTWNLFADGKRPSGHAPKIRLTHWDGMTPHGERVQSGQVVATF